MAEGIVNLVLGKLSDPVVKEVLRKHGVGEQVETLTRELSWIRAFIKDADMMRIVNEVEKHWVNEVKDLAYDIQDVIDNASLLKVPNTGNPSKCAQIVGAVKRIWRKPKTVPPLHNLADEMNHILARIQDIKESREIYGIYSLGEGSGEQPRLPIRPLVIPDIYDPCVVGFDHDKGNILKQLLDTTTKRRAVISIVGPAGLGKTTLAREVYNSNDVKKWFDIRIWVIISQEFKLVDILRKIIEQVERLSQDLEGGEEYLLTKLYKTLNGEKYTIEDHLHPNSHEPLSDEKDPQADKEPQPKKYLLVLDDMWGSDLWIQIRGALPNAMIGSRVIITSRFQNIVGNAEPYKLPYLTEEQSLELLMKKALPNRDFSGGCPDELCEVGKQFVKKCGGLPLALVALGGSLSKTPANYVAWSNMLRNMNWRIDERDCTEIMATSYDNLPLVLKSCFMYFAVFPEDHEIDVQRLFRLWVAEGFVPAEESRILEDTAESFLEDLVQRSLVQVSERSLTGSITHCRIHGLIRELVIQMAKEDNFLTIWSNPDNWMSIAKARRVAVHYSDFGELMEHAHPNLHSLLCFEKPMPNCSRQRLLKVLSDMGQIELVQDECLDAECLHELKQLRYCELSGSLSSNRRSFQLFIGGLRFLETLDFQLLRGHGDLPDDIWYVQTLRHVMLNVIRYTAGPSSSACLGNLQTLRGVRSRDSWNAQLPKLPNVRDLDIFAESSFPWDLMAKLLDTLNHLTYLKLQGNEVPQKIVKMQRFPFYQHLQSLFLGQQSMSPNNKLSLEIGMFPIHIVELILNNLLFKEDPLPVLEKLRSLRSLRLDGEEANRMMSCSAGGFQQLHELRFARLTNLEELEIKAGAMPILECAELFNCDKLRVPLGLQYLPNLKELDVVECVEFKNHADEIRNNICKHVPHILIV
ncbi:disease resistance protein RPP13-like [Carex rostrata]